MLTSQQKTDLIENGFLHLPGAVPTELVENAVQTINHRLGQGFPPEVLSTWKAQSYFPELQTEKVMTDVFNRSAVIPVLRELLGEGNVQEKQKVQLALRFPYPVGTKGGTPHPHIDGIYTPNNGVPQGTLGSFTALVGIFLTDVTRDFAGNLSVWPGSHRKMEKYFREHGIKDLLQEGHTPEIDYGPPLQIHAKAGDAIIAHYQLMHGVTMNVSPFPRYATFFRIKHPLHETNRLECLTNLWLEWPGVRDQVPA
jgi:ectoine hydroxylase-related dioxygenase (phytanoyl-CoA dioxygenase family)